MDVYFDGTFDGFLSAVFDVYALKIKEPIFCIKHSSAPRLFHQEITTDYDEKKTKRVRVKLEQILSKTSITQFWKATLLEDESIYNDLFEIIAYSLSTHQNCLGDFGNIHVVRLFNALKKIGRERHRMTAFVRFEQTTDGVYTSVIEPDFNVLPLLIEHFRKRYADQKWFIFDQKRKYGIYYDLKTVLPVELCLPQKGELQQKASIKWSRDEGHIQNLWKTYFKHTTIETRKNTALHLRHVPKRYWKYLSEKKPML